MWLHACSSIMVDGTLFFLPPLLIITLFSFFNLRFVGRKFKEKKNFMLGEKDTTKTDSDMYDRSIHQSINKIFAWNAKGIGCDASCLAIQQEIPL
jgi:hypothetical protein